MGRHRLVIPPPTRKDNPSLPGRLVDCHLDLCEVSSQLCAQLEPVSSCPQPMTSPSKTMVPVCPCGEEREPWDEGGLDVFCDLCGAPLLGRGVPTKPTLVSPTNGSSDLEPPFNVIFDNSVLEVGEPSYRVLVSKQDAPEIVAFSREVVGDLSGRTHVLIGDLEPGVYRWRVVARAQHTASDETSSGVATFHIRNPPLSTPEILEPAEGETLDGDGVTIRLRHHQDSAGDINIEVILRGGEPPLERREQLQKVPSGSVTLRVDHLSPNAYSLTVRATREGAEPSPDSPPRGFEIAASAEPEKPSKKWWFFGLVLMFLVMGADGVVVYDAVNLERTVCSVLNWGDTPSETDHGVGVRPHRLLHTRN